VVHRHARPEPASSATRPPHLIVGAVAGALLLAVVAVVVLGGQYGLWSGTPIRSAVPVSVPILTVVPAPLPAPPPVVIEVPPKQVTVHSGNRVGDCTATPTDVYYCPKLTVAPQANPQVTGSAR
jgi:hypothetical protein